MLSGRTAHPALAIAASSERAEIDLRPVAALPDVGRLVLLAAALGLALLLLRQGLLWHEAAALAARVEALRAHLVHTTTSAQALGAASERLAAPEAAVLRERHAHLRARHAALANDAQRHTALLRGLARHPDPGVRLTRIRIEAAGQRLRLDGEALDPERLARLLAHLSDDPSLHALRIASLEVSHAADQPGRVRFSLDSRSTAVERP